ncbi:hypothetical protein [Bosea sp. CRIB-10]|uniref:hypothetical protein n=1 Tax=Bosea sp. CRIB-10 TaxID=378404 RepID=UPI001113A8FA|nr:hypothetical protein [Bosea sp. CRIB-10]
MTNDELRAADLRFIGGVLSAPIGLVLLGRLISGGLPSLLAHTVVLASAIAASALLARAKPELLPKSFRMGWALGLALSMPLAVWASHFVADAAHRRAAGRPYCVMVSDGVTHYRTPQNLLDFSPIRMWGKDGGRSAIQFHAALWVFGNGEPKPYNWSYFGREFRPVRSSSGLGRLCATDCLPATDFTTQLSWF